MHCLGGAKSCLFDVWLLVFEGDDLVDDGVNGFFDDDLATGGERECGVWVGFDELDQVVVDGDGGVVDACEGDHGLPLKSKGDS